MVNALWYALLLGQSTAEQAAEKANQLKRTKALTASVALLGVAVAAILLLYLASWAARRYARRYARQSNGTPDWTDVNRDDWARKSQADPRADSPAGNSGRGSDVGKDD